MAKYKVDTEATAVLRAAIGDRKHDPTGLNLVELWAVWGNIFDSGRGVGFTTYSENDFSELERSNEDFDFMIKHSEDIHVIQRI